MLNIFPVCVGDDLGESWTQLLDVSERSFPIKIVECIECIDEEYSLCFWVFEDTAHDMDSSFISRLMLSTDLEKAGCFLYVTADGCCHCLLDDATDSLPDANYSYIPLAFIESEELASNLHVGY